MAPSGWLVVQSAGRSAGLRAPGVSLCESLHGVTHPTRAAFQGQASEREPGESCIASYKLTLDIRRYRSALPFQGLPGRKGLPSLKEWGQ